MSIGKYVTNIGVIGAALGAISTARQTQSMRNDWRRLIVWGVWASGLALAIAGVAMHDDDAEYDATAKEQDRAAKAAIKSAKQARKRA